MDDLLFDVIFARLFSFRPKFWKEGDVLIAKSDWRSQLFCLGFAGRKLVVSQS